ncbi:hypothetical protein UT300005_05460 [Clostridium sp. CTA-5]
MNELIKLNTTDTGMKTVSARELYLGLGLNKSQWSRWYTTNIVNNEFFHAGHDFVGVRLDVEGNETQDFAISLEFAKHIAMMARTEKSHEYRNYFIECEKKAFKVKQLSPMDQLRLQYQVLGEHEEKLNKVESKVNTLENNMTIDHGQACNIKLAVDIEVKKLCCGNESAAYQNKKIRSKVYRYVWRSIKEYFNITAYHNLLRKDIDTAINYISSLKLQGGLLREVQETNNQMCF